MAMKVLEGPRRPLLKFLSLTMCVVNGIYFYFIVYLGHIFLILII